MTSEWRSRPRVLVVGASCAAILIAFGAYVKAQVAPVGAEQQLAQLRQEVSALERRVAELEKRGAAPSPTSDRAAGLPSGILRARMSPEHVTAFPAPFVVVDDDGKVIMRVQAEAAESSRGMYVYGPNDARPMAHVGIIKQNGAGRVWASHIGAGRATIQMMGGGDENTPAQIAVFHGPAHNSLEPQGLIIRNDENAPVAAVVLSNATGYVQLSDSNAAPMVAAGVLESHKGYVKVTPYKNLDKSAGRPERTHGRKEVTPHERGCFSSPVRHSGC